jgi:low temperature requirement protein LtrA
VRSGPDRRSADADTKTNADTDADADADANYAPAPPSRVRDPDEKSDPVELLLDITFVSLLNQTSGLLLHDGAQAGTLHAVTLLLVTVLFWQMAAGATGIVPLDGALRALYLANTGAFLLMAGSVHEAFTPARGLLHGPLLFGCATTAAGLCALGMWIHVGLADRRWRGNAGLVVALMLVMTGFTWVAVLHAGSGETGWLLVGYAVAMVLCSLTAIPFPRRLGIGSRVDHWAIHGARAYRERYTTAYIVGCCLCLELLEVAAQRGIGGPGLPSSMLLLFAAFTTACLLYWLYEPLVDPARRVVDPRNVALSQSRKMAHSLGDVYGHMLMFCGLVLAAGGMRTAFTQTAGLEGGHERAEAYGLWGPAIDGTALACLAGGIAMCLLGQALFSGLTVWRPDALRISAALCAAALVPLLHGRPVGVVVVLLLALVACVYLLDRRRHAEEAKSERGMRALLRFRQFRPSRLLRQFRLLRRNRVTHAARSQDSVCGFELFFDFMTAFTFAQVGSLLLRHPGTGGALRALLVLTAVYCCWTAFCAAANAGRADHGPLRRLHVTALFGLVLLGLATPGAFAGTHVSVLLVVFLAAYLVVRLGSAATLHHLGGTAATRRVLLSAGCGLGAAGCVAAAVLLGGPAATALWIGAACFEAVAVGAAARGRRAAAAGHLSERFAFLVILGLDMSLNGLGTRFADTPIGPVLIAVTGIALAICVLMWWLYFDTLTHYAEHRLHHAEPGVQHRFRHLHYDGLHLAIVAGVVAFGVGLRSIAEDVARDAQPPWGPQLTAGQAAAVALGLAAYLAASCAMWFGLKRRAVTPWLSAAATVAVLPLLVGRPVVPALAALAGAAAVPAVAHAMTPASRAHRRAVHAEVRAVHPAAAQAS